MEKWVTNLVEAPQGIQHLNKKHSSIFEAHGNTNIEELNMIVTTWVCVVRN
jgi:hypothetical protein